MTKVFRAIAVANGVMAVEEMAVEEMAAEEMVVEEMAAEEMAAEEMAAEEMAAEEMAAAAVTAAVEFPFHFSPMTPMTSMATYLKLGASSLLTLCRC